LAAGDEPAPDVAPVVEAADVEGISGEESVDEKPAQEPGEDDEFGEIAEDGDTPTEDD
jgi:hypothetical protein